MKSFCAVIMIVASLILAWQCILLITDLPAYILPSPIAVLIALKEHCAMITAHVLPTVVEMIAGFLLGILFGVIAGFMIAFYRPLSWWFFPLLIISQAIPTFAIAPLLVIWFGYGLTSKIITTIIMIFFPIASSFYDGLQQTERGWLELAKTMNANRFRIFWHIRVPAALPQLASGIRIAAVAAPIGAIVSEWVGSSQGLGYLMLNANARMQIDVMFAVLFVIITLALSLYFLVDKLMRKWVWWQ